jgi:hypothetical protein
MTMQYLMQYKEEKKWMQNKMEYYICAIMKDEQLFLKEWLDYHLSIGFTEIHLYEDFTSTSHKDITDQYEKVYLHSMSEVPGCISGKVGRQIAVYNHFCITHNSGWCLFADIDEYLRLDNISLGDLTNEFKDEVGIEIWWKCYGANGHIKRPSGSIQEAYSDDYLRNWNPCWQFKSFVNLENASKYTSQQSHFINCHYHKRLVTTEHKRGDFRQDVNKPLKTFHLCWIDHYISKSWEDYVERLKRGNITKGLRNVGWFFKLNPSMAKYREELTKDLDESLFPTI